MTQIKREPHDHLPERRDIGPVNSARRSAGTGVPPAEEPAERAAKERQCVRYHRSNGRGESAKRYQSNSQGRLDWSGGRTEEDPRAPACRTAGENIGWVEEAP